jgi:hypothetical protein
MIRGAERRGFLRREEGEIDGKFFLRGGGRSVRVYFL